MTFPLFFFQVAGGAFFVLEHAQICFPLFFCSVSVFFVRGYSDMSFPLFVSIVGSCFTLAIIEV